MRTLVAAAVACSILVSLSQAQSSEASIKRNVNIEAQALSVALKEFAQERQLYLIFDDGDVAHHRTIGATGEMTQDEVLGALLKDTGLTHRYLDEKTVMVVPLATAPAVEWKEDTASKGMEAPAPHGFWDRVRMAQADAATSGVKQEQESAKLEEIVVTAQKREERLQDVPMSISVLGGEQLDSYTGGTARDILRTVPGVTFSHIGGLGDGTQIMIRGVTPAYGSGTAGYYMDGVPFGFVSWPLVPDTNVYDLERIEVLRGPQGTLYGANSLNGVVRVLTHEADLNELQFKSRATVSTTKDGDETSHVDGAINVPIVAGKLAARATVSYADIGGWIDSLVANDVNGSENLDARLKLKAQPTDALSIDLSYWQSRHDIAAQGLSDPNDFYPGTLRPSGDIDFDVYGAEIAYAFSGFTLSSTTSYMDYSNVTAIDWSAFTAPFAPFTLSDYFTTIFDAEVFSEELLVRSSNDSDWRWSAGAFYRDAKDRFSQMNPPFREFFPPDGVFNDSRARSESYAVFGEVTKLLMGGALELTGGLRYFHDRVENSERGSPNYQPSADFEKITPRAVLTWHANEDSTLYASYSQGFRSGVNQNAVTLGLIPDISPVKPDTLSNYEIGAKGNLWNRLFAYEAAVYYIDWQDTQQNLSVVYAVDGDEVFGTPAGVNASSVSGLGTELSLTMRPMTGLSLTAGLGFNDVTTDSSIVDGTVVTIRKGERLTGSSKYTGTGSASYAFPLGGSGLNGTLSFSGSYMSSFPVRYLINGDVRTDDVDPFFSLQGSLSVAAAERWSLQLFADNLTNERRRIQGDPGNFQGWEFYNRLMRPRTVGVQFEFKM